MNRYYPHAAKILSIWVCDIYLNILKKQNLFAVVFKLAYQSEIYCCIMYYL